MLYLQHIYTIDNNLHLAELIQLQRHFHGMIINAFKVITGKNFFEAEQLEGI
jgi:hypothetical protein